MRAISATIVALLVLGSAGAAEFKEPKTGTHFEKAIQVGDVAVECTGTSYRSKWTFKVYGIAHYGDATSKPAATADSRDKRAHWTQANAAKAFVLKFVRTVDAETIREAWSEAMHNADYKGPNGDSLLRAFSEPVNDGESITFKAGADGTLTAMKNDKTLGEWKDSALVRALWATWLGKNSVVNDPDQLVGYPIGQ